MFFDVYLNSFCFEILIVWMKAIKCFYFLKNIYVNNCQHTLHDPNLHYLIQGFRSTNFIIAAMKFQKTLSEKKLSPEVFYLKNRAKSPAFQRFVKYVTMFS